MSAGVAIEWPPCGGARLGLTASQAGATHYHLTATRWQRGVFGRHAQALSSKNAPSISLTNGAWKRWRQPRCRCPPNDL